MRYRLRTLLIVLALGPPVIAAGYFAAQAWTSSYYDIDNYRHPQSGGVIELYQPQP